MKINNGTRVIENVGRKPWKKTWFKIINKNTILRMISHSKDLLDLSIWSLLSVNRICKIQERRVFFVFFKKPNLPLYKIKCFSKRDPPKCLVIDFDTGWVNLVYSFQIRHLKLQPRKQLVNSLIKLYTSWFPKYFLALPGNWNKIHICIHLINQLFMFFASCPSFI